MLLGAVALPGLAAGTTAEQPPPQKLKLTLALASLTDGERANLAMSHLGADAGEMDAPATVPLQLSGALTRLPIAPAAAALALSPPAPATSGREGRTRPENPPAPARTPAGRADAIGLARRPILAQAVAGQSDRTAPGVNQPRPAAAGGADAEVIGTDEFLPADEFDGDLLPARPAQGGGGLPLAEGAPDRPARRWGMAPIRWGGDVSIGLSRSRSGNGDTSTAQIYQGRLRANSYIVQPYIALVSTDFALTTNRSQSGSDSASSNLAGTSITGSGSLNVFPQSRFPFNAALSLSDSRTDGSFSDSNVARKHLSLRQQYRPPVGNWTTAANYDRSELTGDFGRDVVDRIGGDYSSQFGAHSLNFTGELSRSASKEGSSQTIFAGGNHAVQLSEAVSLATSANLIGQESHLDAEGGSLDARVSSAQVFSYINWIPPESKWRGNGSVRYFQTRSEFDGNAFDQRQLSSNLGLNYQASRNLNLSGSVGINVDKDGRSSSAESLSAGYSGDALQLGDYSYNWFSSVTAANSQTPAGPSSRALSASLGHSLSRYWPLDESTNLSSSLSQSISNSRSTGQGAVTSTNLNHSASVSISANAGERLNGYLSASFSDSRSMGDAPSTFQMLNMQLSGNWRIDAYSELNSNLTWQLARQNSRSGESIIITDEFGQPLFVDESSESQSSSLGGSLGYGHRRVMGVRGLRYRADFRANTAASKTARRFGDPNADRAEDQVTMELDQRLLFSIGRLDTELQFRVAEIQGNRHERIFLRATRSFGAF